MNSCLSERRSRFAEREISMQTKPNQTKTFIAAVLALSVSSCQVEPDYAALNRPTKEAQQELVSGLTPVQPKMRFRRSLPMEPGEPAQEGYYNWRGTEKEAAWLAAQAEIEANTADSGWPTEWDEATKTRTVRVMDGEEWELEYDHAELAVLGKLARERGLDNASTHDEEEQASAADSEEPSAEIQGWSNGIDSRNHKEISTSYPATQRELRRIGRLANGCSAVAIGRRILLTAAHCVTNDTATSTMVSYSARQSNNQYPYGTVSSFGVHFEIPSQWYSNGCHLDRELVCHQYDWAIVFLPDDAWQGQTHPGWMGYHAAPSWTYYENNSVLRESGYPVHWSCYTGMTPAWSGVPAYMLDSNGAPISTRTAVAYGTNLAFTIRDQAYFESGKPRLVYTGNDISCGHSGAAIWSDYPGPDGPYALGVNVWERCAGANCANLTGTQKSHPNGVRTITPALADLIANFRVFFP